MTDPANSNVIVFNGEIYNYIELRKKLELQGVIFRGHSDTEVLLGGLSRWGVEPALRQLVGMFAFALWDTQSQVLHLARDRAGKKPLYYFTDGKCFYFASELKAFKRIKDLQHSRQSIYHYLSLGFVPAPTTIYRDVFEVMPGHRLEVDSKLTVRDYEYWNYLSVRQDTVSLGEATEEAEARLVEAVAIRLRSDVPVGIFLSGGLDSGLITAIAAQKSSRPIQTFTVGFDSKAFDESALARQVAVRYGTDHHELHLRYNPSNLVCKIAEVYDQPFADPSAIPTLAIAQETARHVKVVLNGEGGDELFGGYRRHQAARYFDKGSRFAEERLLKVFRSLAGVAGNPKTFRSRYSFFYRFVRGLHSDPFMRYMIWSTDGFLDSEKRWMLRDGGTNLLPTEIYLARCFHQLSSLRPLEHFMTLDFLLGMRDCLLAKVDRATMAYGLEGRSPFLDHRLVEWVAAIDRAVLLRGNYSKPMLRTIAQRYLPPEIVMAPKRGFDVPLIEWTKQFLWSMAHDLCLSEGNIALEIFERSRLRQLLERCVSLDVERWTKRVWLLLILALWGQQERSRFA